MKATLVPRSSFLDALATRIYRSLRGGKLSPFYYWVRTLLHASKKPQLSKDNLQLLKQLQQEAVAVTTLEELDFPSTLAFQNAVENLLPTLPSSDQHKSEGDALDGRSTQLHCFSVDPPELIKHYKPIFLLGLEEHLLDIMEHMLGVPPAFTSVHLRKDIGNSRQVGTRIWHVDTEDQRVVRVIVYLNDVTIDDGPFEYIPKKYNSKLSPLLERGRRAAGNPILNEEMRQYVSEEDWVQCTGPKGTVVIADNAALFHHGRPHSSERIALIYTYTSRQPRYPQVERNHSLDNVLSPRQQSCFFVKTAKRVSS